MNENKLLAEFTALLSLLSPEIKDLLKAYLKELHNESKNTAPQKQEKSI